MMVFATHVIIAITKQQISVVSALMRNQFMVEYYTQCEQCDYRAPLKRNLQLHREKDYDGICYPFVDDSMEE